MNNENQQKQTNQISALTQEQATKSNAIEIPSISLPKGGGALKGIDEKFQVNSANGTAGYSVPLPISPGRNGFSPSLSLSYNSGGGNSPYGLGWSVGYPMIQRKTDKKLPRYRDEDGFMFSGAEDLVPYLEKNNGEWVDKSYSNNPDGIIVKRYRPRIEGGFARIEKIQHPLLGTYWKVTTGDNTATIFGRSKEARIADPSDASRIFQWMSEFSYDDKGNWIQYHYKQENLDNVPNEVYEKNRIERLALFTNLYLKRITYGNRKAHYPQEDQPYNPQPPQPAANDEYFFELVMDYGEHDKLSPTPQDNNNKWDYRPDAFSSYRSGFEIRTNRLCKRILMFHHFDEEHQLHGYDDNEEKIISPFGENYLVRSLDLEYEKSSINNSDETEVTYLKSITQFGFIRYKDNGATKYSKKSLPPMEFTYQKLHWNKTIKTVSEEAIINAPVGLTNNYQWVDLYGEGISGILTEQAGGWFYKNNLGDSQENGEVAFSVAKQVLSKPSFNGLSNGVLSIQDIVSNGKKQIGVHSPGVHGYFELTEEENWKPFKAFEKIVNINLQDPNTRMFDIDGNGQAELVVSEENVFVWYAADGKKGHLPAEFASKTFDEELGPAILFADQKQTIFLSDMAGDGLTDIVRIRNGEICYWANKGYGEFSAKITMGNAPVFDHPDQFNSQYIHLAGITGTGATDIMYLGENTFKAYINLSGNAWSDAHEIDPFPSIDSHSKLSVIDLLGTGTSSIVWSSDLPAYTNAPMRYIDLMDSKKPHVMIHYKNNMGAETTMEYKSSTHYYLEDKLAGKPWITKLPFAVQVVSKMIVEEKITDVRFATEYRYHHGYYDHAEREFRGFGMVEQFDTEFYEIWKDNNEGNQLDSSGELYQPPMLTKTWFHTGAFLDRERILTHFKKEYWYEAYNEKFPSEPITIREPELADAHLSPEIEALAADEYREALRACKGMMLRQEVFALDAPEDPTNDELKLQLKPYTVATHNCNIQLLQPRVENEYGVFIVTESEAISISYERDETDYRLAHTLNINIDNLGNVLESASVVYGRKEEKATADFELLSNNITDFSKDVLDDNTAQKKQLKDAFDTNIQATKDEQTKTHIIYTQNSFAKYKVGTTEFDDVDVPHAYRLRLPHEAQTFELTDIEKNPNGEILKYNVPQNGTFEVSEVVELFEQATSIEYHTIADSGKERRLIEHVKSKYLNDDLSELEFGFFDPIGLPFEAYQLAYTPDLISTIYSKEGIALRADNSTAIDVMVNKGKYSLFDGDFWIRSGHTHFKETNEDIVAVRERFYSPLAMEDPFGVKTFVTYDTESFNTNGKRENNGYYLFIKETHDELKNKSQIDIFNYRTLSPSRMIDINANPSSVLVDELGMVKAVAAEGNGVYADTTRTTVTIIDAADNLKNLKEYEESEGADAVAMAELLSTATFNNTDTDQLRAFGKDLLKGASARFVYDFDVYNNIADQNAQFIANREFDKVLPLKPNVVGSIIREEHFKINENAVALQFGFEYTDGGGNVAMAKAQAEPGIAFFMENGIKKKKDTTPELRWIGTGRTVLNNKGNPVKQYEPYFSTNFGYENSPDLVELGVTPIVYYDAPGRAIKTKLPDGTLTRVEFDSWKQSSFDQNDTVLESQWYIDKGSPDPITEDEPRNDKERRSAWLTAKHANTPSSVYLDSLGRPILSIEHNGKDESNKDRLYTTFIQLDIEGNATAVIDARATNDDGSRSPVMSYKYDMLGHRVYQKSMDAGESWMLNNVMGNPVHAWDSKGQVFTTKYDIFQRPTGTLLQKEAGGDIFLTDKIIYGEEEEVADATQRNLRGQVFQTFDSSGIIRNMQMDFKGQPLEIQRQLAAAVEAEIVDWSDNSPTNVPEEETFTSNTKYDALGRMTRHFNWHSNPERIAVYVPTYNERGVLVAEEHITKAAKTLDGFTGGEAITAVEKITYDEKGQRMQLKYGNGTTTKYHYDPLTFRLVQLRTTRHIIDPKIPTKPSNLLDENVLQNLYYTYDPTGNITEIEDDAYEPVFFQNQEVEPKSKYTYDALYRLIKAEGRENKNFNTAPTAKETIPKPTNNFVATDKTLRNYTQHYTYDPVGNFLVMKHIIKADTERWTRRYEYAKNSNRLLKTSTGTTTVIYDYDKSGNMLNSNNTIDEFKPHWDYLNRVYKIELGGGTAFYQYDSSLERSRKRIHRNNTIEERLYLGGMEVYRKWDATNTLVEEIETHHLFVNSQRILIIEDVLKTDSELPKIVLFKYQYSNHLGSVGLEADENANILSYEEYHPYGTVAYHAQNALIKTTAKRYRYTGMERDEESGLSYHSARYYLPWLGRWMSADPAGLIDGPNLFVFAKNSPVSRGDFDGKQSILSTDLQTIGKSGNSMDKLERVNLMKEVGKRFGIPDRGFRSKKGGGGKLYKFNGRNPTDIRKVGSLLTRLKKEKFSRTVASKLEEAEIIFPDQDRTQLFLGLITSWREGASHVGSTSKSLKHTFSDDSGLDYLWEHRNRLGLPASVTNKWEKRPSFNNSETIDDDHPRGRLVFPGAIPSRDFTLGYIATTRLKYKRFEKHAEKILGTEVAEKALEDLTPDARLLWNAFAFLRPGGAKFGVAKGQGFGAKAAVGYLLSKAQSEGRDINLNEILTDQSLHKFGAIRNAKARAAEAAFLDSLVQPHSSASAP